MASDKQIDSPLRKHHRSLSSSSEEGKSSKRHKHRHHKHQHRHRHRHHRDKKNGEYIENGGDEEVPFAPDALAPEVPVVVSNGGDDDVEEGEILDGEECGEISREKSESNGESGEFKLDRFRNDNLLAHKDALRDHGRVDGSNHENNAHQDNNGTYNSGSRYQSERTDKKSSFTSEGFEENPNGFTRSPSYSRYSSEVRARSRSRSHDCERERSRSHSIRDHKHDTVDTRKYEEKYYRHGRYEEDDRHYSREVVKRESSRERYIVGDESKRAKEREASRHRGRDRDRKRERERETRRERVIDHERREEERGRNTDRDRRRERERDYMWENEGDRNRDRNRTRYDSRERQRRSSDDGYGDMNHKQSRSSRHDAGDDSRLNSVKAYASKGDNLDETRHNGERDKDGQDDVEEGVAWETLDQEEEELNRIKEESRKRRQAILEKYKKQTEHHTDVSSQDKGQESELVGTVNQSSNHAINLVQERNAPDSVASADVAAEDVADIDDVGGDVAKLSLTTERSPSQHRVPDPETGKSPAGLGEGSPKSERSADMFSDDIFGESPAGKRKMAKGDGLPIVRSRLHDNWDDAEGYYSYQFGELLDGRYEVMATHGKGVFSTVVRAKDLKAGSGEPTEVAIKIIRNNETMHKAGQTEVQILKKLAGADPEKKRHCVCFLSSFKYRNHLCLVFESLHLNLREVLKKFGRNIGLKLSAVRVYAKQLFIALKHLKNCGVLHCDIKPDNMLVNEGKNVLKLCDFGNAMFAGKNEVTPYLVSRFYRAPEIILGLPYDHPLDIWSVGCCLYELYCGKVLFPGSTNNDMLRLHMELKGPFPKKMLRKGAFIEQHFDQDLNFHATEEDTVTGKAIKRMIVNIKPKDMGMIIKSYPGEDAKMLANFKDLLDKMFVLDPERRLTVSQALAHPFITGK